MENLDTGQGDITKFLSSGKPERPRDGTDRTKKELVSLMFGLQSFMQYAFGLIFHIDV